MKLTRDIQSLSTFKRDTAKIVRQLKKTGRPVVLTVNGKAELVIQDAESYQKLLEAHERMDAIEGIRRGLESMKRNQGKPAESSSGSFLLKKASLSANEAVRGYPRNIGSGKRARLLRLRLSRVGKEGGPTMGSRLTVSNRETTQHPP